MNIDVKMVRRKSRLSNIIGPAIIRFCRGQNKNMGWAETGVIREGFSDIEICSPLQKQDKKGKKKNQNWVIPHSCKLTYM